MKAEGEMNYMQITLKKENARRQKLARRKGCAKRASSTWKEPLKGQVEKKGSIAGSLTAKLTRRREGEVCDRN